jgi:hypothetical protein
MTHRQTKLCRATLFGLTPSKRECHVLHFLTECQSAECQYVKCHSPQRRGDEHAFTDPPPFLNRSASSQSLAQINDETE